jgi:hypothetical protein
MPAEDTLLLAGRRIPDSNGVVIGSRYDVAAMVAMREGN